MCVAQTMNHCQNESQSVSIQSTDSRSSTLSPTSPDHEVQAGISLLPEDFEPTDNEVILGRGKQIASHKGNRLYKEIVLSHITEYSAAQTKALKSNILSHIVNKIRKNSAYNAGFVKQDGTTGRWMIAEDSAARIATAQIFRDALHDNYKSSKQFKQQRRQDRRGRAKKQKEALREAKEPEPTIFQPADLLQQQQQPPSFPAAALRCSTSASGVNDLFVGQLNTVMDGFSSGAVPSLLDQCQFSAIPPRRLVQPQNETTPNGDVVSVLFNHFSARVDTSANPFEPTPILEEPSSNFSGNNSFHFLDPFSG